MKRYYLILFVLFLSHLGAGQSVNNNATVDSIIEECMALANNGQLDSAIVLAGKALELTEPGSADHRRGTLHIHLGNFFYAKGKLDSATIHYRKAFHHSGTAKKNKYASLMNLGISFDLLGELDSALYYYNRSIEFAQNAGMDTLLGTGYLNFGSFYDDRGNKQTALQYYQRALDILEDVGQASNLQAAKLNIAAIYQDMGRLRDAIRMYTKILDARNDQNISKLVIGNCQANLAEAYLELDSLEQADEVILDLFTLLESYDDTQTELAAYLTKGKIEKARNNLEKAMEYFQTANELALNAQLQTSITETYFELAKVHADREELGQAISMAEKAFSHAERNESYKNLINLTEFLARIHLQLGNTQQANQFLLDHLTYRDSLDKKTSEREVNKLLLEHKENEFQLLKKEQELQDLKLQRQQEKLSLNRFLLIGTVVVAVILLALLTWLYRSRKKERQLNAMLEENNKKIADQNKMLKTLNTEKDRLMHVVAHDLRNPMNAIHGFSQLLEVDDNLNEEQRQNISMIKKSVAHGTDIIEELLSMEAEKPTQLNSESFDISNLINEIVRQFEEQASKKSIDINCQIDNLPQITNDKGKITRIAENLISNAIKFSPQGTEINVRLGEEDNMVKLEVQDNGPGFSEKDKELLFKKFQKLSAKPTADESSTGIGLAIVQDFVNLMAGKITVESEHGQGANMIVYIPKAVGNS